jgi:hypothetical protein
MLPGPQFSYLIVFKDDALTKGPYLRAPPLSAIQMLDSWVVTSKQVLQEISWALPASTSVSRRVESVEQLRGRLVQAFRSGVLCALELRYFLLGSGPLLSGVAGRSEGGPVLRAPYAPPARSPGLNNSEGPLYNQLVLDELADGTADINHLTKSMRVSKALQLSWKSWPGQVGQAALESFSDPMFIMTLIGVTTVYVALWLTPDPTLLTKALAGVLTVALLAQFAWEDIYGLAKAWYAMEEACERAKTLAELQAAGDTFAKKVGQVGFDILLFLVMWRVGKRVQPKLQEVGVRRALARAEAQVEVAASKPGSGRVQPAQAEALKTLDVARARAKSTDPTRILDALNHGLSEAAQKGLAHLRARLGDAQTLSRLENVLLKGGKDLGSFLSHEGVPRAEVDAARFALLKAQQELARIRMIEMKTLWDPMLRKAARADMLQYFLQVLRSLKVRPDWPRIQELIRTRDVSGLVGEMGEALQRTLLAERYPASGGNRIFANVEVVREVKGFKRIADWQAAERAAGRKGDPGGLYEAGGKLWKSITEVDALVAKKGAGGKWRPVELEQMKTGNNDQPVRAKEQNTSALDAMKEIAGGSKVVRIFDRVSKNKLGEDLTASFDLSALLNVNTATRGLQGKGFDRDIPFLREILQEVAAAMVEQGLPPSPSTVPPLTGGQRRDNKAAQ